MKNSTLFEDQHGEQRRAWLKTMQRDLHLDKLVTYVCIGILFFVASVIAPIEYAQNAEFEKQVSQLASKK